MIVANCSRQPRTPTPPLPLLLQLLNTRPVVDHWKERERKPCKSGWAFPFQRALALSVRPSKCSGAIHFHSFHLCLLHPEIYSHFNARVDWPHDRGCINVLFFSNVFLGGECHWVFGRKDKNFFGKKTIFVVAKWLLKVTSSFFFQFHPDRCCYSAADWF